MSDFSNSSSIFLNELMMISTDIVWKDQAKAYANENQAYAIDVEQFMLAKRGMLTFDLIHEFNVTILIAAGLSESEITAGLKNKFNIPEAKRDLCTSLQIEYILDNYVEYNNYYRMLNGLPDIDDRQFLYNTKYPNISDSTTPIHMLTQQERYSLESSGYINELIKSNPDKKYLKYFSKRRIDIYIARSASRFSILWMNDSEYSNLVSDFVDVYESCRYAINRIYYAESFKKDNEYYDGFMAMCVLFMTIQMMHYKFLDADITRDFYDLESIRYIYESYGVPFYSSIPLEYHKQIVKNINILLSYKGSTRVFFELFDIFNYGMMDVYEYYILKTHRFANGKPVFAKNPDGSYDLRAMYEIKFGKVRLYDDPPMELSRFENHIPYSTMIEPDVFWVSDQELLDKLYNEEYNYLETKYTGIQTLFNLMKIMYEASYYFKILFDNRYTLESTNVYFTGTSTDINIFTMVVYLSALMCKKYGYAGNIASELSSISRVLGYDFKANITKLRNDAIKDRNLKKDSVLINMLIKIDVYSLTSITTAFKHIDMLRNHLVTKMCETHDKFEYQSYYELYNTLMYSELIHEVYKKSNGEIAESFEDLLMDIDISLYIRLQDGNLKINDEIAMVLSIMKKSCSELKYIELADGVNIESTIEYLFKILEFFKSEKSDLTGYNIIYTLSSRSENVMKILSYINMITEDYGTLTDFIDIFDSSLYTLVDLQQVKVKFEEFRDRLIEKNYIYYINSIIEKLDDQIKVLNMIIKGLRTDMPIIDHIANISTCDKDSININMQDRLTLINSNIINEFD